MKNIKHWGLIVGLVSLVSFIRVDNVSAAGYEFEGLGARQVSRAGAAIADSNDWTAIYWNPGNIIHAVQDSGAQVGVEAFGGKAYEKDSNSLSSIAGPVFSKEKIQLSSLLGATGAVLPLGKKFGLGFGFYTPLLQGSKFSDSAQGYSLNLKNSAGILTWNLSGAYQILSNLSVGGGLNLLYGRITTDITLQTPGPTVITNQKADGLGLEGVLGARYDPIKQFSLGAVYRSGSDVKLAGQATASNSAPNFTEKSDFTYKLKHPSTYGIGTAYRPTDRLTFTMDYDRTLWHRFKSNVVYKTPGSLLQNSPNTFHWKDTWKVRIGTAFKLTEKTELLGGYSYDNPALDGPSVDLSTALDVPMHRFSTGVAHKWTEKFESTAGIIGGSGTRREGDVKYRLSGYQVMLEGRYSFL